MESSGITIIIATKKNKSNSFSSYSQLSEVCSNPKTFFQQFSILCNSVYCDRQYLQISLPDSAIQPRRFWDWCKSKIKSYEHFFDEFFSFSWVTLNPPFWIWYFQPRIPIQWPAKLLKQVNSNARWVDDEVMKPAILFFLSSQWMDRAYENVASVSIHFLVTGFIQILYNCRSKFLPIFIRETAIPCFKELTWILKKL